MRTIITAGLFAAAAVAAPAMAATVGSASYATLRNCSAVTAADPCDGTGPGQNIATGIWGGGTGVGGWNTLTSGPNRAWSFVAFDAALDLPTIKAYTEAPGNVRTNINTFAFQSYTWSGASAGAFSITGNLDIVDSSSSPGGGALPGGAIYTAYAAVWDPGVIAGLSTPQELFSALFYAPCGTAGVLGAGNVTGTLTGGPASFAVTSLECTSGSLFLTPGQEVLVVVGLQLPVNRGGFADASATFTTTLGANLSAEEQAVMASSITSAIAGGAKVTSVPEPASWALLIAGFGLTGAAARRRRPVHTKL
jgi:hypothetical protein